MDKFLLQLMFLLPPNSIGRAMAEAVIYENPEAGKKFRCGAWFQECHTLAGRQEQIAPNGIQSVRRAEVNG
jgi:hypothetical protein